MPLHSRSLESRTFLHAALGDEGGGGGGRGQPAAEAEANRRRNRRGWQDGQRQSKPAHLPDGLGGVDSKKLLSERQAWRERLCTQTPGWNTSVLSWNTSVLSWNPCNVRGGPMCLEPNEFAHAILRLNLRFMKVAGTPCHWHSRVGACSRYTLPLLHVLHVRMYAGR